MLVIENDNYSLHNPHWKFTLGPETYETKDTPQWVESIKKELTKNPQFHCMKAKSFPEKLLAQLHPYHAFIKKVSHGLADSKEEVYPDLFPGEGAGLPKKMNNPLWGGLFCTDAVTPISNATYDVARGSAQAAMTGVQMLANKKEKVVYALCRPSGHHAGPRVFGGYCYFNNAATAAQMLSDHGRVAVIDLDYHHGNGTQEFFFQRKDVFTSSIHGDPAVEYPYFWGYKNETGKGVAEGTNLNFPLPLKSDNAHYLEALDQAILAIKRFAPTFLVISAGFDTHQDDPIGGFLLTTEIYRELGGKLSELGLPTLIVQEGGYNLNVLGACVYDFLCGFANI